MKFPLGYCYKAACAVIRKGDFCGFCERLFAYVNAFFELVCLLAGPGRKTGEKIWTK